LGIDGSSKEKSEEESAKVEEPAVVAGEETATA